MPWTFVRSLVPDLLPLTYRRPVHVKKWTNASSDADSGDDSSEKGGNTPRSVKSTSSSNGIPAALSLDRIVQGGTCPPCTTRDMLNFMIYVERDAELLQFFLWFLDYQQRFFCEKALDVSLSQEWTQDMEDEAVLRFKKEQAEKARRGVVKKSDPITDIFAGTDFDKAGPSKARVRIQVGTTVSDPFSTPPPTPLETPDSQPDQPGQSSNAGSSVATSTTYRLKANQAFAAAGVKPPFSIQPFREELDRIISVYLMAGSPRQLNLSDRELKVTLQALAYTTHPSVLRLVVKSVEATLRQQSHPNFIRWTICNGNPLRVTFARSLGVGTILVSTLAAILLTLSRAPRGYRALPAIGWVIGIATLVAAYKGMCVVLHGLHHHHVRPWELFVVDENDAELDDIESGERRVRPFDPFGGSNSFETEPWVVRYQKRNVIRKIFDRQIWIKEPALRQIQDTIFVQSLLFSFICAGILTAIFVNVPGANLF
ncbi:hypothetical protein QBC38DRAFT_352952 [Podospora fimiseda]|uniref:RGS domain-containing protein n=1 Tax=Podospora fimiseda TaxID=252190 RepID=A0AAN7H2E3_9PEZI|nr:hypothetical protein QBC38DRAFT_352952 [Podospora fimiseda]